jgi:hypothetical protein
MEPIITDWGPSWTPTLFGHQPTCLYHCLPQHPLFTRDALAELIERCPPEHYLLVHMGPQGSPRKLWRQGAIGKLSGHAVIDAIEAGRLWINLLRVNKVDPRHQALLDTIYAEIHNHVPNQPRTYRRISGVLISSPRAQVYYHFDTVGQNLWQIAGSKRVYVYPATAPFVTDEMIERITLYFDETSIAYESWYDAYATTFDLQPGQLLHWQLNAPHRIENGDALSISLTTEFQTDPIRRHVLATSGNGLLRSMGLHPSRTLNGPAFYAKAALFAAAKKSGLIATRQRKPTNTSFVLSDGVPS